MKLRNLCPGAPASNCYLLSEGGSAILIDCSVSSVVLSRVLEEECASLCAILLTHGHFDHMLTVERVKEKTNVPVYIGADDMDFPMDSHKNAFYTACGFDRTYPAPDLSLNDGDVLTFGGITLEVLHTPGHTPGSVTYLCREESLLFTGDLLFAEGYGRFDLVGGDRLALQNSLQRLSLLPGTLAVYPGHGRETTLSDALSAL